MQLTVSIAFAAFAVARVYAQGPMINTPSSLFECEPAQLTFGGGQPPYFLTVLPAGQIGATPLENLPQQTGSSFTWTVDLASGTSVTLAIRDSTGAQGFTAPVTVQAGTSSSCVGQNSSGSGSSTGASSTTTAASSTTGASSTTAASSTTGGTTTAVPTPSSISRPATSAPSSASAATTTRPSTSAGSATTTGSPAASTSPNAGLSLTSGPAAGVIGVLLAAFLA